MTDKKNNKNLPIGEIDRLIHEPSRLLIMAQLYVVECVDFIFLMRQTEMTQGNLSTHLNKLETGGYITVTKKFVGKKPRTLLALSKEGKESFKQYVSQMKKLFDGLHAEID